MFVKKILFCQAIEDVSRHQITVPKESEFDLMYLKQNERHLDFLKKVSKLDGYGELTFPHCACSSRKNGHVIVVLDSQCLRLKACTAEGALDAQVVEFAYEDVLNFYADHEAMSFVFEIHVPNKPNKTIKIHSSFVSWTINVLSKYFFLNQFISLLFKVWLHVWLCDKSNGKYNEYKNKKPTLVNVFGEKKINFQLKKKREGVWIFDVFAAIFIIKFLFFFFLI